MTILTGNEWLAATIYDDFLAQHFDASFFDADALAFCEDSWYRQQFERFTWPFPAVEQIN